jgi:hypothetical protein
MSSISGHSLAQVVAELSRRKVKLYHACQLADFESYLQLGGVPSRNLLATKALPYTTFDTDDRDHENSVWRLVFFNLSDFGYGFAQGGNNLPNIYGPILLCLDPQVMCKATDVSIALRSAGAKNFDRIGEGISADDVPRLFKGADSQRVKFAQALREEFGSPKAQSPEMSCSFQDELAPLSHLAYIRVDPYSFSGETLLDAVRRVIGEHNASWCVYKRSCADGCEARYGTLLNLILSGIKSAHGLKLAISDGSPLSNWRDAVLGNGTLPFQFERYVKYLSEGTLPYISNLSRR